MQRHVQHYHVNAEIGTTNSPVIGLQIDALIGEQELRIESCLKRSTLKQIHYESNNEPEHDCNSYDEGTPLECGCAEDSTIKDQDRKLDYGYRECILKIFSI